MFYPRFYGLIVYLDVVLRRLLFLSLFIVKRLFLPVEGNLDAYRLAKQNDLSAIDYHCLMIWITLMR